MSNPHESSAATGMTPSPASIPVPESKGASVPSVVSPKLNFPWFIYPGTPFTGYMSDEYIPELHRLESSLRTLGDTTRPILFHLTIGSPMEEAGVQSLTERKCMFQMYQLIPDHILRAAKNGITVVNYVVCPNVVDPPMFMATGEYRKISKNEYKHNSYPITIYFFTTMMPTKDKRRNDQYMEHFIKNDFNNTIPGGIEMYRQTPFDRSYVDQFYDVLTRTVSNIRYRGGFASCFSFAVFNDDTINRKFNHCVMFKEVIGSFPDSASSCLFEWTFRYGMYVVHNIHSTHSGTSSSPHPDALCFVPPLALGDDAKGSTSQIMEPFFTASDTVGFSHRMLKDFVSYVQDEEMMDTKSKDEEDDKETEIEDTLDHQIIPLKRTHSERDGNGCKCGHTRDGRGHDGHGRKHDPYIYPCTTIQCDGHCDKCHCKDLLRPDRPNRRSTDSRYHDLITEGTSSFHEKQKKTDDREQRQKSNTQHHKDSEKPIPRSHSQPGAGAGSAATNGSSIGSLGTFPSYQLISSLSTGDGEHNFGAIEIKLPEDRLRQFKDKQKKDKDQCMEIERTDADTHKARPICKCYCVTPSSKGYEDGGSTTSKTKKGQYNSTEHVDCCKKCCRRNCKNHPV